MPTPMLIFHVLQGADGDASLVVGMHHVVRPQTVVGVRNEPCVVPAGLAAAAAAVSWPATALAVPPGGSEPSTASVSESRGGSRRPAVGGEVCWLSCADGGPVVTVVVRCYPVVRGPDVAPAVHPSDPILTICALPTHRQIAAGQRDRSDRDCPPGTGRGRCGWHKDGTPAGEPERAPAWRHRHQLACWARPVQGRHLPRWQGPQARGSFGEGARTRPYAASPAEVGAVTAP
jgi:hypothetical protein